MQLLVALVRAHDLGVHPREVVVDVVLLLVGVSLDGWSDMHGSNMARTWRDEWTYGRIHALAQFLLKQRAALHAVARRRPASCSRHISLYSFVPVCDCPTQNR